MTDAKYTTCMEAMTTQHMVGDVAGAIVLLFFILMFAISN